MKKIGVLLLSVMLFLASFVGFAQADTYDDMFKYAQDFNKLDFNFIPDHIKISSYDWKYSSDMQNVTFDGKIIRNIYSADVITDNYTNNRLIHIDNLFGEYCFGEFSSSEVYNELTSKNLFIGSKYFLKIPSFPTDEPLYLDMFGNNGNPITWYNSTDTLKTFFIDRFNDIINEQVYDYGLSQDTMKNLEKNYIANPEAYTGYAGVIVYKNISPEEAKKQYDINNTLVAIKLDDAYNSKEQFTNFPLKNTYIEAWRDAIFIYFKNLDTFKQALKSGDLINNENSIFSIKINLKPNDKRILLNGQIPTPIIGGINEPVVKELPIAPVLKDGTTYVPVKGLFEELGAQVSYDDSTNTAIITKGNLTIKLKLGSNVVDVNGNKQQLSDTIPVVDGHVLIPLRFVSETLGYTVKWDGNTQIITIEALDM
ncbi:stalk domain-containing protein [Thermoanaerobacterium sp. R66]|uniref:stalk domain-containing protein n=1 Tax=Thermoanaerobacterium sp. R66 TaxID=2742479 RepID=UPI0023804878|nr:stalk domain-containing protein [Thermoanaerobacterium sp. R66]MDE4542245.1 hypothetical protein [Thermoanaerobacterium sp. R66]